MQIQVVPVIILVFYVVGMFSIGFLVNKFFIKDSTDYMVAGRQMGVLMVACSLSANNVGGGSTTGVATKAFAGWGLSAAWYVIAAAVAMVPLSYFAPKIRKTMAVTIPEVVHRRFGSFASSITAILNISSLICLTASQILASAVVISSITNIPQNVCLLIAAIVIAVYTSMGGMMADGIADIIQFFVILIGLAIAVPFIINGIGGIERLQHDLPPVELNFFKVGIPTILSLIFNYFCTFISGPEISGRFAGSKNEDATRKSSLLSALFMVLMAFLPTVIGLCALAENPGLDGGQGTSALMWATSTYAPGIVTGIVSASIVAATMSSADSNLLCSSTILIKDIYQRFINPDVDDSKLIRYTRISNITICILATLISLFKIPILTLNLFAFALRSAGPFAAYALGLVVPKATKNSGIYSIIVGSITVIIWQVLNAPFGILPVVFGSLCGVITFMLVTYIESSKGVEPAPSPYID
ncbi:sodium:solute symporter family protein [Anaerococcus sp. NML200574]|uniref:sodium:solute symporter family protein n=1 Tax=Anaerococcus sp. NML200574 TaxID=2954486 RepID=UPI0022388796|nr:sodium:solute symporter family protein [Anaerococcus sp. NML200574]MCW6677741.1 sodium:solute symporter family protein [Anaerococcus sp. NML200574]